MIVDFTKETILILMIKYRFTCTDKDSILCEIEQRTINDFPCGKSLFGGDLYRAGIHFQRFDKIIKGFYIEETETEVRGTPIRVCFKGKFIEENNELLFDCYIYPAVFEFVSFICAVIFIIATGGVMGAIIAIMFFAVFIKSYYDMINETYSLLSRIFI